MKILIFTYEFAPFSGGISTYIQELAAGLFEQDHEVQVLAPKYDSSWVKEDQIGYEIIRFSFSRASISMYLIPILLLLNQLVRNRPDVIIAGDRFSHIAVSLIWPFVQAKTIFVIHGSECTTHFRNDTLVRKIRTWLIKRSLSNTPHVIAISTYSAKLLEEESRSTIAKLSVVHHGINCDNLWRNITSEEGSSFCVNNEVYQSDILTVSRLEEGKGHEKVLEAISRLIDDFPNIKYRIVGDGECRESLIEYARELGISNHVIFHGNILKLIGL